MMPFNIQHNAGRIGLIVLSLMLNFFFSETTRAQNTLLDQDQNEVCLQIGVRAAITGLDDFNLTTMERSGESFAQYSGSDRFFLESNAPVRILVNSSNLANGLDTLETEFKLDGNENSYSTSGQGSHAEFHEIAALTKLGSISSQLAGEYSTTIMLTVVPQITIEEVCQQTQPANSTITEPLQETFEVPIRIDSKNSVDDQTIFQSQVYSNELLVPPALRVFLTAENGRQKFPLLSDYLEWKQGNLPMLSEEAKFWWLFPADPNFLKTLIDNN